MNMRGITWYFDFISPYAYFSLPALERLKSAAQIEFRPILLAGVLKHWGQRGPAEIVPKRAWTYRACVWWAQQHQIPFRMPAVHPFNPLPYLRLAIAAGSSEAAISAIFRQLWTTGDNPADVEVVQRLARSLSIPEVRLADADVKHRLRATTEEAVQRGVFGVPTLGIDEQLFWGNDALDFAYEYLVNPAILESPEMKRADATPVGVTR